MRWLIGLIALIGLALAMRAGLVAFAGYVILGVFFLSRYLSREWITHLSAERVCETKPREVGDEIEVTVRIHNDGKLPVPWVLTEDLIPDQAIRQRRVTFNGSRIRLMLLRAGQKQAIKYRLTFRNRGYYQLGPCVAETGDVFGLHRRHRVLTDAVFILVYPRVLPLAGFDFSSSRPIGEIRLANMLFEDPTRSAGVRPYMIGDPLQRVHWRATARTGQLHSRVYEPTSLAGATVLLDFHTEGYPSRNEPNRSELAVTLAASLANAVLLLNQQIGLASNGRDATERIREEALEHQPDKPDGYATRGAARDKFAEKDKTDRLRPVVVETRRGYDQFQKIRETLARLELTDGMTFDRLVLEMGPRMPRDATVIALLPRVPVETSVALGQLRRQGFAVSVVLVGMADDGSDTRAVAAGRLMAEGIRDVRFVNSDVEVMALGDKAAGPVPAEYAVAADLA
jgi:uncharacterized protein (DUF58 family)